MLHIPPFYGLNASKKSDEKDDINNRVNVSFIGLDVFCFGTKVISGGGYDFNSNVLSIEGELPTKFIDKLIHYRNNDKGDV